MRLSFMRWQVQRFWVVDVVRLLEPEESMTEGIGSYPCCRWHILLSVVNGDVLVAVAAQQIEAATLQALVTDWMF
jgi:hypothetical protein